MFRASLRVTALTLAVTSGVVHAQTVNLHPVPNFPQLPNDIDLGPCSAVSLNSRGEVLLFHRGKQPILRMTAEGRLLGSWGDDVIVMAHGLRIDRDDNVWITDIGSHRVIKFSPAGKVLLTLGTGQPGDALDQFNKPTDIAFGDNGELYVTDGYGNNRVLQFAKDGKLIRTWGNKGMGNGEFNLPHSIVVDGKGRVLVGDRENKRVQVFTAEGQHVETWTGFSPYGMVLDGEGLLFVADGVANKLLQVDNRGNVRQSWGEKGTAPGQFDLPHMLACDAAGNIYVAEIGGKRLQKFARR